MTTPDEEHRAMIWAGDFLTSLIRARRVPKGIREEAVRVLRHYPGKWRINHIYEDK